jgi:hypothetical protein
MLCGKSVAMQAFWDRSSVPIAPIPAALDWMNNTRAPLSPTIALKVSPVFRRIVAVQSVATL